jgi:hypothetical protein
MRTEFHLFNQSWKPASGAGKQIQAIVSRFLLDPQITIYYHKNPYIAVSSGHKLGTCIVRLEGHFWTWLKEILSIVVDEKNYFF